MLLKRLVFFGGKGGVGKSTLSCGVALRLSKIDKTILLSVDPAHSLSGILGVPVGSHIKHVKERLFAVELDARALVEEYAQRVLSALGELLPSVSSGIREYARYLKSSPTAQETAVLDRLLDYCQEFTYVVVDSAPTGQMLRFFETAHMVEGWYGFLHRVAKERHKVESFMGREDKLIGLIQNRKERLETLIHVLREKALVFAVANEEPLSLQEAKEIREKLRDMKVYTVINRWHSMECDCIKVPETERPYGLEALEGFRVEEIVEFVLR